MSSIEVIALTLSALLMIYLGIALLKPEWFS
jgi:K+-transporting ATPase KdpF subunit